MAADPYFANVSLLLSFDGSNGSTTFTDRSSYAHTPSAVGSAQISTAHSVFGGASLYLPGGGSHYLSIPSHAAFDLGTDDFTIEFRIRVPASGYGGQYAVALQIGEDGAQGAFYICNASTTNVDLDLQASRANGSYEWLAQPTGTTLTPNTWHAFAVTRASGDFRCFLDGVTTGAESPSAFDILQGGVYIGFHYLGDSLGAYIDELRITKGIARYTANYTPATEAFGTDSPAGTITLDGPLASPAVLGYTLGPPIGQASADSPLDQAEVVGTVRCAGVAAAASPLGAAVVIGSTLYGWALAPSPLAAPSAVGHTDYTGSPLVAAAPVRYVMDMLTPGGTLRVPISSWQATLRTDSASYVQCVIPAAAPYLDGAAVATEFVISRVAAVGEITIEQEMARAPVDAVSVAQGGYNHTATLMGYAAGVPADDDPSASNDRTLSGIRTIYTSSTSLRVRCSIDWLLRPQQRAHLPATSFVADTINYYVSTSDAWMDVASAAL